MSNVPATHPADELGVTYRQLDYWTRKGYLLPTMTSGRGSGHRRTWPDEEVWIARTMGRLVAAGIEPAVAASAARRAQRLETFDGPLKVQIAPNLFLELWPEASHG